MPERESLVIKIRADSMLVMSTEGRFRSFPLPSPAPRVGERLVLSWPDEAEEGAPAVQSPALQARAETVRSGKAQARRPERAPRRRWPWAAVAAAAAMVVALLGPVAYEKWALAQPAAVVAVDINPSLELTLDGRQEVRQAAALNHDAVILLQDLQLVGLPVEEALVRVVERAEALGYLRGDAPATVVATVTRNRGGGSVLGTAGWQERLEAQLEASHLAGYVRVGEAPPAVRQAAGRARLSVNQYLAMVRVREAGVQVDPDAVRGMTVRAILGLARLSLQDGFPGGLPVGKGEPGGTVRQSGGGLGEPGGPSVSGGSGTPGGSGAGDTTGLPGPRPGGNSARSGSASSTLSGTGGASTPSGPGGAGTTSGTDGTDTTSGSGGAGTTSGTNGTDTPSGPGGTDTTPGPGAGSGGPAGGGQRRR